MQRRSPLAWMAGAVLVFVAPTPGSALASVRPSSWTTAEPIEPVLAVIALAAWACAGWLLVVAALCRAARLTGRRGRAAAFAARLVAPAVVRRWVAVSVGASVLIGGAGLTTAAAAEGGEPKPRTATARLQLSGAPAPSIGLDWPVTTPPGTRPPATGALPRAAGPVPPPVIAPPVTAPPVTAPAQSATPARVPALQPGRLSSRAPVVVARGDCLWDLAAASLARQAAGAEPTDRQISAEWPRWWAANRQVVGDDPDVIQPGTRLVQPESDLR